MSPAYSRAPTARSRTPPRLSGFSARAPTARSRTLSPPRPGSPTPLVSVQLVQALATSSLFVRTPLPLAVTRVQTAHAREHVSHIAASLATSAMRERSRSPQRHINEDLYDAELRSSSFEYFIALFISF